VTSRHKRILAVIILIEVILAAAAWRNLARRTDDQIRGNRNLWRMFVLLNPGNSLFYWLLGRRGFTADNANGSLNCRPPREPK
jgi:hypothetical protein